MYEIRYETGCNFVSGNRENRDTSRGKKERKNHEKSGIP